MMECTEYRRGLLAEPARPSAAMLLHVAMCHDCTLFTERVLKFEDRLQRALRIEVETGVDANAVGSGSATLQRAPVRSRRAWRVRRGGMALAASVLLVAAGGLWLSVSGQSLAADVVGHMAGEPNAWARTDVPVPASRLRNVLDSSHVGLQSQSMLVSYASSCTFRGHRVPHLVVQTKAGPVTVMVLGEETVLKNVHFDEQGYRGVIVPVAGHGSLAVLEQGATVSMSAVEGVASQVRAALDWAPRHTQLNSGLAQ